MFYVREKPWHGLGTMVAEAPDFGRLKVQTLKKSDVKQFYNKLLDERRLRVNTIDNVHTVLHQVLQIAVEDNYMRNNVSDNVLRELKQSHNIDKTHKKALTIPEQNLFLEFLKPEGSPYHHWYPVFTVMLGTGMRVGEVTGLRWCDIDCEENMIEVNHTLVYYNHAENGCYFNVHTPKTEAGKRRIPMLQSVKEAFLEEKKYQEQFGLKCTAVIDGYTDVTKELARREFEDLDEKLMKNMESVDREQGNNGIIRNA